MKLESPAFSANGLIPAIYTCDRQDISPALSWDDPPAGTQSFALICDDPDAPGKTWVHWVLYDLPATTRELLESVPPTATLENGGIHGTNDFGRLGYGGPCPPSGTHRYFFKLYALERKLGLKPGATKAELLTAMAGHILAETELMGRYARQK
jgi:Raf kinase inhibitor-like YbhB/YbcL family protein